jgi:hypothetical protein
MAGAPAPAAPQEDEREIADPDDGEEPEGPGPDAPDANDEAPVAEEDEAEEGDGGEYKWTESTFDHPNEKPVFANTIPGVNVGVMKSQTQGKNEQCYRPTVRQNAETPMDYFHLFFTKDIMEQLMDVTNLVGGTKFGPR